MYRCEFQNGTGAFRGGIYQPARRAIKVYGESAEQDEDGPTELAVKHDYADERQEKRIRS